MFTTIWRYKGLLLSLLLIAGSALTGCQRGKFQSGEKKSPIPQELTDGKKAGNQDSQSTNEIDGADGDSTNDIDSKGKKPETANDADDKDDKKNGGGKDEDEDDRKDNDGGSENDGDTPSNNDNGAGERTKRLLETLGELSKLGNPGITPGSDGDTPLVLDWNRDGIIRTALQESKQKVWFDINGNGRKELVDWIGASEAILALDLDGNGKIDSGRELFGNATEFMGTSNTADNGFIALAQYDDNRDGLISTKDRIFPKLLLWMDHNANGVSEPEELKSVLKTSIVNINVTYAKARIKTGPASEIRQISTYTLSDGKTFLIGDIHFYPQPELAQSEVRKSN